MRSRFLPKLNYANVIASIALFVALGGAAVAATSVPRNSVGPNQLKRGAVTPVKIRKGAVTAGKLAPGSVVAGKLGANAVLPGNIGNGAISTAKLGEGSVIASKIKNSVVTTNKLNNEAVTSGKLGKEAVTNGKLEKGSVTLAKLGSEVSLPTGTLHAGQTLRGVFDVGGTAAAIGDLARGAVNFQVPLEGGTPPAVTVLKPGQTTSNCAGGGANGVFPTATNGNLCVYIVSEANLEEGAPGLEVENNTRLGFGLRAKAKEGAAKEFHAFGVWAVTGR
jgi:hypothetical protein